jgi:hypothetical protein
MNSSLLKRSFNQIVEFLGGGWIALGLAILVIAIVVYLVFRSGKQIKIRIPFLPKGMNMIKIGRDDLKKVPLPGGQEAEPEDAVVGQLFDGLDTLSGTVKKRYDLPIYLMLSQYESANSFVADIGQDVLERLDMKDRAGNDSGSCVILNQGGLIYHQAPTLLADELIRSRPERPLDGLVIVVSAADLLIENRVERRQKIDWLFQQYWAIQNKIEFMLPVYLVVSGMETLQGFDEYGAFQKSLNRIDDIFGWSNPYSADTLFDPALIDEAFRDIGKVLSAQMSDFIESSEAPAENILVFANSVRTLHEPVKAFASGVLNSSLLINPPKFRGIYFTGQMALGQSRRHRFIERLFQDKVFPEYALAAPVHEKLLSADRRLRRLQVVSAAVLFALVSWTGVNIFTVWDQSQGIEQAAERLDGIWRDNAGFEAIQPSLQILSDLNASKIYCCGPIPWSLAVSPNAQVESFFQRKAFGKRILPAMECKSRQRLETLVNPSSFLADGSLRTTGYSDWLSKVGTEAKSFALLQDLMGGTHKRSEVEVYQDFSDLISRLYGQALPEGFGDNAALYIRGIRASEYQINAMNAGQCRNAVNSGKKSWGVVVDSANAEIAREVTRIAAPLEFLAEIFAFESNSIERNPISSDTFASYVRWHRHIQKSVGSNQEDGFCATTTDQLMTVGADLRSFLDKPRNYQADVEAFTKRCEAALATQMESDNRRVPRVIYQSVMVNGEFLPVLSEAAEGTFNLIDNISEFSFSDLTVQPWTNEEGGFFWSVDLLAVDLGYAD